MKAEFFLIRNLYKFYDWVNAGRWHWLTRVFWKIEQLISDDYCGKCNAPIRDSLFVVNWGLCDSCFDKDYMTYLESKKDEPAQEPEDAVVVGI